jgi:uridine phosphorylase
MKKPNPAELVINPDGSVYHLKLRPEQLAPTVLLVGDPGRVPSVSKYFDRIDYQGQNREIATHTGFIGPVRITVMSTGMGTDNIDIVLNELDALVNIDFETRAEKPEKQSLRLIRIGTTGSLHPYIPVNAFILSGYGLGLDTLLNYYLAQGPAFRDDIAGAFIQQCEWPAELGKPYVVSCNPGLAGLLANDTVSGITATAPGFYGPQGRRLRLPIAIPGLNERLMGFDYMGLKITNLEMETSALYGLSALMGHQALTVCLAIANRATGQFSEDYKPHMDRLIRLVLEKVSNR